MSSNIAKIIHEPQLKKWHAKEHLNAEIREDCLKLLGKVSRGCHDYTWDKDEFMMYWVQAKDLTNLHDGARLNSQIMHSLECSNKSYSLQTAWTSYVYDGGSSSADPTLVDNSSCKVFLYSTGELWLTQCLPHPRSQDGMQYIPLRNGCQPAGI